MTPQAKSKPTKSSQLFGLEKFIFWQRWLLIVGLILVGMGLYMIFLRGTVCYILMDNLVNPVFWASTIAPANVTEFQGYVYGVWGATVAIWGTFVAFIAHYPFRQREKWARDCIFVTTLLWYLSTAFVSLQVNYVLNVVANTVVSILLLLPLFFTRKDFSIGGVVKLQA